MAEVVKSGQMANGGTGVFIPRSMAAAMAAAEKEKNTALSGTKLCADATPMPSAREGGEAKKVGNTGN
jgi:hypothetical protein